MAFSVFAPNAYRVDVKKLPMTESPIVTGFCGFDEL
jgi:hypothetical protein